MPLASSAPHRVSEDPGLVCEADCPDVMREGCLPSYNAIAREILRVLNKQIAGPIPVCSGLEDHGNLGSERYADIRTRFLLWTGNLGVLHKPDDPRALDMRLQDSPEVASRVRGILGDFLDLLYQSETPCNCNKIASTPAQQVQSMDEEEAMMMQLLGLQTSKSCTTSWVSASLDDTLRRLFHLSSLITKSATRDKFARAELKCRLQMYEAHDIRHALEKVTQAGGQADESLIKRLGKANTSRRQFIAYSHKHQAELSCVDKEGDMSPDKELTRGANKYPDDKISFSQSVHQSEKTKQSAVPTKASTIGAVNPNAFDYGLDDARSCTTVATSIVDEQAFSGLKVPELTRYARLGEHFLCPLCQTLQRFNGQITWRRHVFSDIRAYICTSASCGMLMFGSFNTWRSHEMDHRREWFCPLCALDCQNRIDVKNHLNQCHGEVARGHQVEILLQTSSRPPENLSASACPFCDWSAILRKQNTVSDADDLVVPSRRFMRHLGRHLEEYALFVIPQLDEDDGSSDALGSNAVHASGLDESATMSTISSFKSKPTSTKDGSQPEANQFTFGGLQRLETSISVSGVPSRHSRASLPADGYAIYCICGFAKDDGNLVECDTCKRWAHIDCYYPEHGGTLPDSLQHWCVECRPNQAILDPEYRVAAQARTLGKLSRSGLEAQKALCPCPTCGKHYRDTKAHMLTHQSKRQEKCPVPTCEYHTKGFARKYDKNRHTLMHYKGSMVCGFCPGSGSSAEKSFNRADVFKRHLTSVHGVEQKPPNARRRPGTKRLSHNAVHMGSGICSTCGVTFANAQDFYEHLDDCILRVVLQADPTASMEERLSTRTADDPVVPTAMRKPNIPTLNGANFATGGPVSLQAPSLHRAESAADHETTGEIVEPLISNHSNIASWNNRNDEWPDIGNFEDMPNEELDRLFFGQSPQLEEELDRLVSSQSPQLEEELDRISTIGQSPHSQTQPYTPPYPSLSNDGDQDTSEPDIYYQRSDAPPREVPGQHDGHKEPLNCPVRTCKKHTGKGLSRMSRLVKHLATVHSIKTSASQLRDYHSALSRPFIAVASFEDYVWYSNDESLRKSFTCPVQDCGCRRFGGTDELVKHLVVIHRLTKSQAESHLTSDGSYMLKDYHLQLMLLERQNEERKLTMQREGDITPSHPSMLPEDDTTIRSGMPPPNTGEPVIEAGHKFLLENPQVHLHSEEWREQRQVTASQEQIVAYLRSDVPLSNDNRPAIERSHNHKDQDYQMQLLILEQQNKKRQLMARQEQESMPSSIAPHESSSIPLEPSPFRQGSPSAVDQAAQKFDEIDRAEEEMHGKPYFATIQGSVHKSERLPGVQSILKPPTANNSSGLQSERWLQSEYRLQSEHRLEQSTLAGSSNAYDTKLLNSIQKWPGSTTT